MNSRFWKKLMLMVVLANDVIIVPWSCHWQPNDPNGLDLVKRIISKNSVDMGYNYALNLSHRVE